MYPSLNALVAAAAAACIPQLAGATTVEWVSVTEGVPACPDFSLNLSFKGNKHGAIPREFNGPAVHQSCYLQQRIRLSESR
jgi:hypothetical protein